MTLLAEVARGTSGVKIMLDDSYDFRGCDPEDVTCDDRSGTHRIIDDEHRHLVTPGSVDPDELPVLEQPSLRVRGMQAYEGAALRVPCSCCDIV
jgi:hypothetical protein